MLALQVGIWEGAKTAKMMCVDVMESLAGVLLWCGEYPPTYAFWSKGQETRKEDGWNFDCCCLDASTRKAPCSCLTDAD